MSMGHNMMMSNNIAPPGMSHQMAPPGMSDMPPPPGGYY